MLYFCDENKIRRLFCDNDIMISLFVIIYYIRYYDKVTIIFNKYIFSMFLRLFSFNTHIEYMRNVNKQSY